MQYCNQACTCASGHVRNCGHTSTYFKWLAEDGSGGECSERILRILIAALLVLYAKSTVAIGFSPPMVLEKAALREPQIDEEFTITLVVFFWRSGRKCLVTRNGPTTFVVKTCMYSSAVLHNRKHVTTMLTRTCFATQSLSGAVIAAMQQVTWEFKGLRFYSSLHSFLHASIVNLQSEHVLGCCRLMKLFCMVLTCVQHNVLWWTIRCMLVHAHQEVKSVWMFFVDPFGSCLHENL